MSFEWKEEYETYEESVDRQHKKLFEYVNILKSCIANNEYEGEKIDDVIEFFGIYTVLHFRHEEKCMALKKCTAAEKNKTAHRSFISIYKDFKTGYDESKDLSEKKKIVDKFHLFCEDWLVNHICKIDIHLRACTKKSTKQKDKPSQPLA
jgi:hemerythrin-like metal-binding protein